MGFWFTLGYYVSLALVTVYVYLKLTRKWCTSSKCLVGKTTLVTGANTGIGYETALDFAKRGAKVVLACRNEQKAKNAVEKIVRATGNDNVSYKLIDLSDTNSVRKCAEEINQTEERLDILVNNAGVLVLSGKSVDGHNLLMQTNYYGHFLFTVLLIDLIKKTPKARIVNVSSKLANYWEIDPNNLDEVVSEEQSRRKSFWKNYSISKLCNILFTIELANKLKETGVTTYSLHPGVVDTDIFRIKLSTLATFGKNVISSIYFRTPLEGCQTTLYCSLQEGLEKYNGEHFDNCSYVERYSSVKKALEQDPQISKKLWKVTEKLVGLKV